MHASTRAAWFALVLVSIQPGFAQTSPPGAWVTEVNPQSAAARAGLQPGDIILARKLPAQAEQPITSVFDAQLLEIDHPKLAPYVLSIRRETTALSVEMQPGTFGLELQPVFVESERETLAALTDSDLDADAAVAIMETVAGANRQDCMTRAWLDSMAARRLRRSGRADDASPRYATALARACVQANPRAQALLYEKIAAAAYAVNDFAMAKTQGQRALALRQQNDPDGLGVARSLARLTKVFSVTGDTKLAEELGQQAAAIYQVLAPQSMELAEVHHQLGNNALFGTDDLVGAQDHHWRALEIRSALEPNSLFEAISLGSLSTVAWRKDELIRAEDYARQALPIAQDVDPDGRLVASMLGTLANITHDRFNLAAAEEYRLQALEIFRRYPNQQRPIANLVLGLANIDFRRDDYPGAIRRYEEAKALYSEVGAARGIALINGNLANLAKMQQRYDDALALAQQAIQQWQDINPEGNRAAVSLIQLAAIERDLGEFEAALDHAYAAEQIFAKTGSQGLTMAQLQRTLGLILVDLGRSEEAWPLVARSLEIGERLAPGTLFEALPLNLMGRLTRNAGRLNESLSYFARALKAFESQRSIVGGSQEDQGRFSGRHDRIYEDYIDALLEAGRQADAFHILERYRARVLLQLWAERSPVATDLPPELREEQGQIHRGYQRTLSAIGQMGNSDSEQTVQLLKELDVWREKRERLAIQIAGLSPRLAAIEYPQPLTVAEAVPLLRQGTLVVSFLVSPDATYLFALSPPTSANDEPLLQVHKIDLSEATLATRVDSLRTLIKLPNAGSDLVAALENQSKALFDDLLGPVESLVANADHLLVLADGPLHFLPFAALTRTSAGQPHYLVEDVPIHTTISLTTYGLVQAGNAEQDSAKVLVLANPINTVAGSALPQLRGAAAEAAAIVELFPTEAEAYLEEDATEGQIRSRVPQARIAHVAAHAVLDSQLPLDSYLVLASERQADVTDNGLLHAWEIIEGLRIKADLVTLSGCETFLGGAAGGEGLMGLTRAFHYAGARSVMASLWRISDATTPALMQPFYRGLVDGLSRDEALRRAQLQLIHHQPSTIDRLFSWLGLDEITPLSHPYYWAAFQLSGVTS